MKKKSLTKQEYIKSTSKKNISAPLPGDCIAWLVLLSFHSVAEKILLLMRKSHRVPLKKNGPLDSFVVFQYIG